MIVHQTTDYSQFKKFASNRPTVVKNLLKSIREKNQLSSHPIIVTKNFYVVDGQHRLECAKIMNVPIYFIIDPNIDEEDIPRQQIQKPWKLENFQHFYKGYKENYMFMQKLIDEFHFPPHILIALITKGPKQFIYYREGKMEFIKDKNEIYNQIKDLSEVLKLTKIILDGDYVYRDQLRALWRLMNDHDYEPLHLRNRMNEYPSYLKQAFKLHRAPEVYKSLRKNVYDRRRLNRGTKVKLS